LILKDRATRIKIFNSPKCTAVENGICNKNAEFVLQYKIQGIIYNDTFCRFHAHTRVAHLRDYLGLKVKIFEFDNIKEKVQFT
jgi:hypothetical protein